MSADGEEQQLDATQLHAKRPLTWEERVALDPGLPEALRRVYTVLLGVAERHNLVVYISEEEKRLEGEQEEQ